MYDACGPEIVCGYPRGMALLPVASLCLSFSQACRAKAGEPRCSPRHLHLKPVDVPIDVFEGPREAGVTSLCAQPVLKCRLPSP